MEGTGETEVLDCGLVLRSVGYRSTCIEEKTLPFDHERGVIPNQNGRIRLQQDQGKSGGQLL